MPLYEYWRVIRTQPQPQPQPEPGPEPERRRVNGRIKAINRVKAPTVFDRFKSFVDGGTIDGPISVVLSDDDHDLDPFEIPDRAAARRFQKAFGVGDSVLVETKSVVTTVATKYAPVVVDPGPQWSEV